jgi:hypothetical protein
MNYEELNALNHNVFDKMHQSKGRKENLGDDFTTKGSNCLRLMI